MLKGLSTILKGLFTLEIQDLSTIFEELKEFSDVLDDYHKDFIRLPQSFLIISFFEMVETGNMGLVRHNLSFFTVITCQAFKIGTGLWLPPMPDSYHTYPIEQAI